MSRMRKRIAERLKDSQNTAAMLTTYNEIDMTSIIEMRNLYKDDFLKKHNIKLGFMSMFVAGCLSLSRALALLSLAPRSLARSLGRLDVYVGGR
jgi:pyruvate/2-oxoglutarate dehydrogenase complex dihydrolipoamide acyltransferase (E2) component